MLVSRERLRQGQLIFSSGGLSEDEKGSHKQTSTKEKSDQATAKTRYRQKEKET